MEMLELRDLHKTFNPGTVNEKVALNGVSLTMEAGDFATIVGSNGAGKSTLFNAITGGFIADEGSITLGGEDITFAPEYQRSRVIGHLFQDPLKGTAPNMTIEENLALAYLRAGTAPNAIFSRISRKDKEIFREKLALLDMGLEDRMKQPVGLLSGGQRQALTLLMATLVTPKLLLLDEHTAALDPATAEKVLDLTKSIVAEKKITCLMVTHNMHQALELGNRTLMMDAGRIVFDVKGEARSKMTVDDLLEKFRENAGKALDITALQMEEAEAEQLKLKYGDMLYEEEETETPAVCTLEDGRSIELNVLNDIIDARAEEILANVWNQLQLSGYEDRLLSGIIFTGGGANLKNMEDAFRKRSKVDKVKTTRFVHNTIHGFSDVLKKDGMQNTLLGLLAAGNENCCLQEVKPAPAASTVTPPKPVDMFGDDEALKEQEAAARAAKAQREKEEKERRERERKEKERKEKEEKKKKKKEGPSWFEKTFNKISNEIFSDDDLK